MKKFPRALWGICLREESPADEDHRSDDIRRGSVATDTAGALEQLDGHLGLDLAHVRRARGVDVGFRRDRGKRSIVLSHELRPIPLGEMDRIAVVGGATPQLRNAPFLDNNLVHTHLLSRTNIL